VYLLSGQLKITSLKMSSPLFLKKLLKYLFN
jgi:hypothetical protein